MARKTTVTNGVRKHNSVRATGSMSKNTNRGVNRTPAQRAADSRRSQGIKKF